MTDIGLFSLDEDNVVRFGFANCQRVVRGPEEALQVVAYHLINNPGTCAFDRDEGGGLKRLLGMSITTKAEIQAEAAIAISRALGNIRKSQSANKPADATIIGLRLLDVQLLRNELKISLTIRIDLLDGNSFQATFRLS